MNDDAEVQAIALIWNALAGFDGDTRQRMLEYLGSRSEADAARVPEQRNPR